MFQLIDFLFKTEFLLENSNYWMNIFPSKFQFWDKNNTFVPVCTRWVLEIIILMDFTVSFLRQFPYIFSTFRRPNKEEKPSWKFDFEKLHCTLLKSICWEDKINFGDRSSKLSYVIIMNKLPFAIARASIFDIAWYTMCVKE